VLLSIGEKGYRGGVQQMNMDCSEASREEEQYCRWLLEQLQAETSERGRDRVLGAFAQALRCLPEQLERQIEAEALSKMKRLKVKRPTSRLKQAQVNIKKKK